MIAILLSVLFLTSGLVAAATIAANWPRYRQAFAMLRAELAGCEEWREVRVRIDEVSALPSATVLRPNFTPAGHRPSSQAALPAAA